VEDQDDDDDDQDDQDGEKEGHLEPDKRRGLGRRGQAKNRLFDLERRIEEEEVRGQLCELGIRCRNSYKGQGEKACPHPRRSTVPPALSSFCLRWRTKTQRAPTASERPTTDSKL
jgi:hypothetical protein